MQRYLYDTLAERWYRGGTVWLYSDPHFADKETTYLRINNISDEEQLKRINSKVGKNDTIIILGDLGDIEYIKKIRGYKVLIMGNHEKGASNYKRIKNEIITFDSSKISEEDRNEINNCVDINTKIIDLEKIKSLNLDKYFHKKIKDNGLFDEVYEGPLMINDRLILSHEPMVLPDYIYNIHGHDHAKWFNGGNNHLNVCAEYINYTPVSLTSLMKNGLLKDVTTIHRTTINNAIIRQNKKELK